MAREFTENYCELEHDQLNVTVYQIRQEPFQTVCKLPIVRKWCIWGEKNTLMVITTTDICIPFKIQINTQCAYNTVDTVVE